MNKSNPSTSRDRLSELPDSLIFEIFWLLPMREVVRTSLLSQRWKNLWNTAPFLNFEDRNTKGVREFISWATMLWRGSKILKLKIDFGTHRNNSLFRGIDQLVRFAKENEVEELYVCLKYDHDAFIGTKEMYWAPECFYSCSSIKRLCLKGCNLRIPAKNVSWNRLEVLTIDGYVLSQDLIDKVLCGSPKLDSLILKFIENHEKLSIQSSSLTLLSIYKHFYYEDDEWPFENTELRISTPNLISLRLLQVPYRKIFMSEMPLLTFAKLLFHRIYGNDFAIASLRQILPMIQHVETLMISDCSIEALGDMKDRNMLSPFPNVKILKLNGPPFEGYEQIVHLLEIFPKLERLILRNKKAYYHGRKSVEFEENLPDSFLQHLSSVVFTRVEGEDPSTIFPLMKILLKYASKLEKVEFHLKQGSNPLLLQFALLSMPRSSPTAKFIYQ